MYEVLGQMAALVACGAAWRALRPLGIDAGQARPVLTSLVYVLLLPALVLDVIWRAPLGLDSLRVALVAAIGVLAGMGLGWAAYRLLRAPPPAAGAMILASAFPNATYLGLPVLEQTLGPWAKSVAIQYDLFACTPLLLTLGMLIARSHGHNGGTESALRALLKVPPLWAAIAGAALNLGQVPEPVWLHGWLDLLARPVIPLMLIALGMGLEFGTLRLGRLPFTLPVLVIQLLLMPLLAWGVADAIGLQGPQLTAVVLEAAMPSMVLGIVICDRYGLDAPLYAAVVTLSTVSSLVTLPLWFQWLQ